MTLNYRVIQYLTISFFAILFVCSAGFGFFAGRRDSYSALTINNVKELRAALKYFYDDQDRYPSASEFGNRGIMLQYLSVQPVPSIVTDTCSKNFLYSTPKAMDYKLDYCLESNFNGGFHGWNTIDAVAELN